MTTLVSTDDIEKLWRPLKPIEKDRAIALVEAVTSMLIVEGRRVNKDIIKMSTDDIDYLNVVKSVIVDIVSRTLMTSTEGEPLSQESQSANGYSWSGTYLVPGGGIFIKTSELKRLGFRKQKFGGINLYGEN